jgi:hypothetical protein
MAAELLWYIQSWIVWLRESGETQLYCTWVYDCNKSNCQSNTRLRSLNAWQYEFLTPPLPPCVLHIAPKKSSSIWSPLVQSKIYEAPIMFICPSMSSLLDSDLRIAFSNTLMHHVKGSKHWSYWLLLWKQLVENILISSSPLAAEDHIEYIGLTHESLWRRGIRVMTGNDYSSCRPRPISDPWGLCPSEWAWLMSTSSPHLTGP